MFSDWQGCEQIRCTLLFGIIHRMLDTLWQFVIESCYPPGLLLLSILFCLVHGLMLLFHSRIMVITGLLNDQRDKGSCNLLGCYIIIESR